MKIEPDSPESLVKHSGIEIKLYIGEVNKSLTECYGTKVNNCHAFARRTEMNGANE
jgi:hypothetical protein